MRDYNDLTSRQEIIDEINLLREDDMREKELSAQVELIKEQLSYLEGWKLCSEEPPRRGESVLVCHIETGDIEIDRFYGDAEGYWWDKTNWNCDDVAWKKLPLKYRKAAAKRQITDVKSDLVGGLQRTIRVYTANGDLMAEYEGKIDLESNEGGYVKFDFEGKRYIYYNCFVEVIGST